MIEVPPTFRAMPRWWTEATFWLDALPRLVAEQCDSWGLAIDGPVRHGSNALVVPVRRHTDRLALRMAPPTDDVVVQVSALRFWAGSGTVGLIDSDVATGALLLERLDADRSLRHAPLEVAVPVLARIMRRLALPAPPLVPSTADAPAAERHELEARWGALGAHRFAGRRELEVALEAAALVSSTESELAVNADLHSEQVLGGRRESWLVVDPVLMRGDIERDLAQAMWTRLDEMRTDAEIRKHLSTVVGEAGLDAERAKAWVLYRSLSYLLWGLEHRLTEDPVRCGRLLLAAGGWRAGFS